MKRDYDPHKTQHNEDEPEDVFEFMEQFFSELRDSAAVLEAENGPLPDGSKLSEHYEQSISKLQALKNKLKK